MRGFVDEEDSLIRRRLERGTVGTWRAAVPGTTFTGIRTS